MSEVPSAFLIFLRQGCEAGGFGTDDVLAAVLPLFEQISDLHENGRVAPLDGVQGILVDETQLRVDAAQNTSPKKNFSRIESLQKPAASALEIIGEKRRTSELDDGHLQETNLNLGVPGAEIARPVYLTGYVSWEHQCGHHDQLTDIFSAGLILVSLACGLDFTEPEDLELFVNNRNNLFALNKQLHPVLAGMILQMTELNRHRRVQTLEVVVQRLRRYRDQTADYEVDFTRLKGFRESAPIERGQILLTHLRNRLFEISRRNRLIHFKPTLQTLNLTLASVPLLLDHRNIKSTQLFLWHDLIAKALASGESIVLGQYLRFEDAPYASGVLDQIIATERRDRNEFGFAQLRLVICFLRWHNLKETPAERIHSPLLLLPVELVRRKGVRDAYVLRPLSSEAEVNPALRHHLKQLYGLNLPEIVDLAETNLDVFYELLVGQIRASEPGVTLIKQDRPQIELIHERARQRLDQFRRRQRLANRGTHQFDAFDYSYDRDRFRPLGLQLFLKRVKPARPPFGNVLKAPIPRQPNIVDPVEPPAPVEPGHSEKEKGLYTVREQRDTGNPYQWDFDLCSQTLGNFNYRKMSLVQDYSALLEKTLSSKAFESIFSLQPRPRDKTPIVALPLREQFPVVECDPTQTLAVARAREGESYIIQGPPGTGKSQTITNLIADFVARGKRVLFVCEKRAAIDVVFHRLGRQGLDELCCLIHDSQTDKREFILNLKQTYDKFLNQPLDEKIESRRAELLQTMELELAALQRWSDALESQVAGCSITVRALLGRLVDLHAQQVELDPVSFEQVPAYGLWQPNAEIVRALAAGLRRLGGTASLSAHSFRHLTERVLTDPHPLATITAAVAESESLLGKLTAALEPLGDMLAVQTLSDIEAVVAYAASIAPLAAADALDLLNPKGTRTKRVQKAVRDWRATGKVLEKQQAANGGWKDKLPPTDTAAALAQAKSVETSFLRWLSPTYWRLRKIMLARYDFTTHAVAPAWSQILANLQTEHEASAACEQARLKMMDEFGELDGDTGVALLDALPAQVNTLLPAARALHSYLVENSEATYVVENLEAMVQTITRLRECLGLSVANYSHLKSTELAAELHQLRKDLVWLPDVLPLLLDALRLPADLQQALRQLPLSDDQLEAAMARKSLAAVYQQNRALEATDGNMIARRVARLETAHHEWLGLNARWIHQRVRREFLRKVQLSTTSATQLAPPGKELKRLYSTGRRELEHEFSKTMRHRSIRDLADDETGVVLRDLKPVWLMSPLSVSDTLPLATDAFDLVIFDEASQILVEEAIPTVFRAPQAIVVGDEMQLPPTNFFSASRTEEELLDGDPASSVVEDLDADSFLTQAARNLPSTMLGWHYRSRSEALISYSNHAFYEGRLLTIPDRKLAISQRAEITAKAAIDGKTSADALLARSVSFHFMTEALYEQRCNTMEAEYIAQLTRELLNRETGMSIGIVAFSEAQQGEIESALSRLAADDKEFSNRLAAEYEREEAGQFCGLFVKNLENVQGDERDIILLSVCYGYDRNRRMLMNFGPINQRGGEKRLNVIFSRARKHMAVISSIRHFDITNDYNDGACCLRNFLEYAVACSVGDGVTANRVLQAANPLGPTRQPTASHESVGIQLAAALRERGHFVECDVGQSTFRLPLAIRRAGDESHVLGLLLDDDSHYAQRDLLERFLLRPGVLRAFGWKTLTVFTKDWHHDREGTIRHIEEALAGVEPEITAGDEAATDPVIYPEVENPVIPAVDESAPPVIAPVIAKASTSIRQFTCSEEGANKFWESSVNECLLTVRFGRVGTKGQTQTKTFSTPDAAIREQEKLIRSKLSKGYIEKTPSVEQE
jgi:predicted DNA-binding WGR domain protein